MASSRQDGSEIPAVLIVDDDPNRLTILNHLLEPLGYELISAPTGEAALKAVLVNEFAAILLDVSLPGIDGYATAELIRERPRSSQTPILFMTAATSDEVDQDRGYALGAVDYLFGPPRPAIVRAKVHALVKLSEASRLANAANLARSEFMNLAAHELKGPLTVMSGYVSMLRDGSFGAVPKGWERPLATLTAKVGEVASLVQDLQLAARVEGGDLPLSIENLDLAEVVSDAVERARPRVDLRNGEIAADPALESVTALGDRTHLARILDNLINNAIIYSREAPVIRLDVCCAEDPTIGVADSGAGIPAAMWERIFDRMTRHRHAGLEEVSGSGLGLYISRTLARRQNGDLLVAHSELGVGSRFELKLQPEPLLARRRALPGVGRTL